MMQMVHSRFNALLSACVLSLIATASWSQSITWLGTLGGNESRAYGVSADGAVVVGGSYNAAGRGRAFRWTASGGMQDLGRLPGSRWGSAAYGVSADGAVVVGKAHNAEGYERAFRWTASGGMQELGMWSNSYWSAAYGVSADGSVVVGWADVPYGYHRAFRWKNGVTQNLALNSSWNNSEALGVSADGSVVVGQANNHLYNHPAYAFRWGAVPVMEDLKMTYILWTYPSELYEARAISPDGRYIVGWGRNAAAGRQEAFLLDTQGTPPCTAHNGDVNRNGCVDDADLLAVLFAFGQRGSNLGRVDVNCDGAVDDADLLIVLFNFGSGC